MAGSHENNISHNQVMPGRNDDDAQPLIEVQSLTEAQFNAEIEKGFADLAAGKVISADSVADKMRREYGE